MSQDRCDLICIDAPRAEAIRERLLGEGAALDAAERAKALSDPTRLTLAEALREGEELCVCDLSWIVGRSQNLVSHHLRTLRSRGLVRSRKDGKMVMYSLTEARGLASLRRGGCGVAAGVCRDAGVSRPKKMLPVLGQASPKPEAARDGGDGCTEDCCSGPETVETSAATPRTREANPETPVESAALGVLERTVVRVEGMDCASCAATVEKRVAALPGVSKATVNFAAGRLDAEHDPGLALEELEGAVRAAGYGVAKTEEAERTTFWRTPTGVADGASALLFLAGLALSVAGAPEIARVGAYLAAIIVGGLPIFRAAVAGLRARHLDMNVLMSAATVGRGGYRGVGGSCLGGGPLRRRQRAAGLRHRPHAGGREGARAPCPERGTRQEGQRRGHCSRGRGRSRRYGGRQARREAGSGRQGRRGLLGGGRVTGDGRERAGGEGSGRRSLLRLPQRPGRAASRGDERAGRLDAAEDRAPRGGGAGDEGPRGAVRGPLLAGLHARGGGRGCRAGGRAAATRRWLRRAGSTGRWRC